MIERKTFRPQVKAADEGRALVVIATLNAIDQDGDVTLPGYFGEQVAPSVGAHDWASVPIGKARVFEQGNEALAEIRFNLDTAGGKDWFAAVKFDLANPPARQEYSYGFDILAGGTRHGEFEGREVRFLSPTPEGAPGCRVLEVSPVLLGAGVGTRTLEAKGGRTFGQEIADALAVLESLEQRAAAVAALRAEKGKGLSPDRVADLKALRDRLGRFADGLGAYIPPPQPAPDIEAALRLAIEFEHTRFQHVAALVGERPRGS